MEVRGGGTFSSLGNPNFGPNSWWQYTGSFTNPDLTYDPTVTQYASGGGPVLFGNPLLPSTQEYEPDARISASPIEKASLANFLYEFRDMPRQMQQTANFFQDLWRGAGGARHTPFMHPTRAAEDFLNIQFGWLPFIGDIFKLCDAVIFSQQYVHDISVMNNTWVKRKKVFPKVDSLTRIKRLYSPGCEPSGSNIMGLCRDMTLDGISCKGYMDVWDKSSTLVWSEGEYKYYRPEFDMTMGSYDSVFNDFRRFLTITGGRVNPIHVWRAIPWTWAIDWFARVGENIKTADAMFLDGWLSRDLYLMHHRIREIYSDHFFNFFSGGVTLQWSRLIDTKQRKVSDTPYTFGLTGKNLTANQWAILTALGLSRNVNMTRVF